MPPSSTSTLRAPLLALPDDFLPPLPLHDYSGDTLIFTRTDNPPHRLPSHIFTPYPYFNKLFNNARLQARLKKRHDPPSEIEYILDLTPPEEGDAAIEAIEALDVPTEVLQWRANPGKKGFEVVYPEDDDGGEGERISGEGAWGEELVEFRRKWEKEVENEKVARRQRGESAPKGLQSDEKRGEREERVEFFPRPVLTRNDGDGWQKPPKEWLENTEVMTKQSEFCGQEQAPDSLKLEAEWLKKEAEKGENLTVAEKAMMGWAEGDVKPMDIEAPRKEKEPGTTVLLEARPESRPQAASEDKTSQDTVMKDALAEEQTHGDAKGKGVASPVDDSVKSIQDNNPDKIVVPWDDEDSEDLDPESRAAIRASLEDMESKSGEPSGMTAKSSSAASTNFAWEDDIMDAFYDDDDVFDGDAFSEASDDTALPQPSSPTSAVESIPASVPETSSEPFTVPAPVDITPMDTTPSPPRASSPTPSNPRTPSPTPSAAPSDLDTVADHATWPSNDTICAYVRLIQSRPTPAPPSPLSYTRSRHSGALERILLLLSGQQPHVYSAPMWYTMYRLSIMLGLQRALAYALVEYAYIDRDFIEQHTGLCFEVAYELQNPWLYRDCFALLVARRASPYPISAFDPKDPRLGEHVPAIVKAAARYRARLKTAWELLYGCEWVPALLKQLEWAGYKRKKHFYTIRQCIQTQLDFLLAGAGEVPPAGRYNASLGVNDVVWEHWCSEGQAAVWGKERIYWRYLWEQVAELQWDEMGGDLWSWLRVHREVGAWVRALVRRVCAGGVGWSVMDQMLLMGLEHGEWGMMPEWVKNEVQLGLGEEEKGVDSLFGWAFPKGAFDEVSDDEGPDPDDDAVAQPGHTDAWTESTEPKGNAEQHDQPAIVIPGSASSPQNKGKAPAVPQPVVSTETGEPLDEDMQAINHLATLRVILEDARQHLRSLGAQEEGSSSKAHLLSEEKDAGERGAEWWKVAVKTPTPSESASRASARDNASVSEMSESWDVVSEDEDMSVIDEVSQVGWV